MFGTIGQDTASQDQKITSIEQFNLNYLEGSWYLVVFTELFGGSLISCFHLKLCQSLTTHRPFCSPKWSTIDGAQKMVDIQHL